MQLWDTLKSNPKWKVIAPAAAGLVFLLLSELWPEPQPQNLPSNGATAPGQVTTSYEEQLEQRLESLITQISGAGSTEVMVTVFSAEEVIYAQNTQQTGEGAHTETHVLLENGTALTKTTLAPQISGVAVVCEGGSNVTVVARITEMLSALLDLPTHRISVQTMK